MDKLERILKSVFNKEASSGQGKKQGNCLSDEEMSVLVESKCSSREEEKYSRHILSCHSCADLLNSYLIASRSVERTGSAPAIVTSS